MTARCFVDTNVLVYSVDGRLPAMVQSLLVDRVVPVTPELVLAGIKRHREDQLPFWEALIVEAAVAGRCDVLYSEDLQDGRCFDMLRVVNPFA